MSSLFKKDVPPIEEPAVAQVSKAAAASGWNPDAFPVAQQPKVPMPEPEEPPTGYGSLPQMMSADGIFSERVSDRLVSLSLSFWVPLILVFLAEAEDKSQVAIGRPSHGAADTVVGLVLGFLPAVFLAVFIGFILERQLSDQRMLFLTVSIFLALGFVSLSQALLHLNAATASLPVAAQEALISIMSAVRPGAFP